MRVSRSGLLLLAGFLLFATAVLDLPGRLSRWIEMRETVTGRVFDEDTQQPVPGATVLARSQVPGTLKLRFWDPVLVDAVGRTDSSGWFSIPMRVVGSTSLSVVARGYSVVCDLELRSRPIAIPIHRQAPDADRVVKTRWFTKVSRGRGTIFVDLDRKGPAEDSTRAELAIEYELGSRGHAEVRAMRGGGVLPYSARSSGQGGFVLSPFEHACQAPVEGHVDRASLAANKRGSSGCFDVRTEGVDGTRYGRVQVGLSFHGGREEGTLSVRGALNPRGLRNVCGAPPMGEDAVRARLRKLEAQGP